MLKTFMKDTQRISLVIVFILLGTMVWFTFSSELTKGATDTVTLDANISTSVSCSSEPDSTGFGTLTTASIFTATSTATTTMSCNYGIGCNLGVSDAGDTSNPGLYNSGETDLIDSSTAELAQNTEGYGIQATTTAAGSGGTLTIAAVYDKSGNFVGGLQLASQNIASSTVPISGREVVVSHKATIGALNKAGSYTDTITYECLGN